MNKCKNQSTLLIEIMIAVLFFALCSTVLLETFAASREYSRRAALESDALVRMQDMTERMYAAADLPALLKAEEFVQTEIGWMRDFADYRLELELNEEMTESGVLRMTQIRALAGDQVIAEIPGARYLPEGGAQ